MRKSDTACDNSEVRAGASPSQNGIPGGWPFASSTRTTPELMRKNSPRRIAELKDVARETFDREILVDRAEESFRRIEHYTIICVVGNCAAGRQSNQPRTASSAQTMIDCIVMNQRRAPAALGAETFSQHFHYAVEFFASEIAIRPGRTDQVEGLVFIPILSGRRGDNLLCQNIERFFRNDSGDPARRDEHNAARQRIRPVHHGSMERCGPSANHRAYVRPVRRAAEDVAMDRVVPSWQTRSTEPMSMPSSSEAVATSAFEFAALQSVFRIEAQLRRKTSVMRRHRVRAEQFAQMMRHAFGHSARVDEDQSGPVRLNQLREAVINFLPDFVRHHGFQRRLRKFDRQVQFAAMTDVDDCAIRIAGLASTARVPTRNRATSSIGFCVADKPIR